MADVLDRLAAALADRYVVEKKLGEGGMATVYLAQDIKHDRQVALKVLRPELAAVLGAERFLNEIKVTAKLQHPNILPLYDSGEADTFLYYVMPLVEGETLRDKLNRETQLSIAETLEITKSVAAALQFAHERDIVHRDIKPENILLQAGQALVADFGIALAVGSADQTRMTETGLSVGTPHYMSPEQAMGGKEITPKSDVYALGCMVYEMLIGEPPFTGPTAQAIVAKVVVDRPRPVRQLRATVPPHVEAAVDTALEKLPADRFDSMAAFAGALGDVTYSSVSLQAMAQPVTTSRGWKAATIGMIAVAIVAAIVVLFPFLKPSAGGPLTEAALTRTGVARHPAFSPDGQFVAYVSEDRLLMIKETAGGEGQVLVDSAESVMTPRWSPDGREILFGARFSGGQGLYTVTRLGLGLRLVVAIDEAVDVRANGYSYHPNGSEIVTTGAAPGTVNFVDLETLRSRTITLDQDFDLVFRVAWSPDGKWIGFMGLKEGNSSVGIMSPEGVVTAREAKPGPPMWVGWGPGSDALYHFAGGADDESDFVVWRVNSRTGAFRGDRKVVMQNVLVGLSAVSGVFDIDSSGTRLVYTRSAGQANIWTIEAVGDPQFRQITRGTGSHGLPSVSPDGAMVAYDKADHLGENIYVQAFGGGAERAVSSMEAATWLATWSPSGGRLAFRAQPDTGTELLVTVTVPEGQVDRVPFPSWPATHFTRPQFLSETRLLVAGPNGPGTYDLSNESFTPLNLPGSLAQYFVPFGDGLQTPLWSSGERFVTADSSGAVYIGDVRAGTARMVARFEGEFVIPLGWTNGGEVYAQVGGPRRRQIWRIPDADESPQLVFEIPPSPSMMCWSVSRDARRFTCNGQTGTDDLWIAENFDQNR